MMSLFVYTKCISQTDSTKFNIEPQQVILIDGDTQLCWWDWQASEMIVLIYERNNFNSQVKEVNEAWENCTTQKELWKDKYDTARVEISEAENRSMLWKGQFHMADKERSKWKETAETENIRKRRWRTAALVEGAVIVVIGTTVYLITQLP